MFTNIKMLYFLLIKYLTVSTCELFAGVQLVTVITNETNKHK